eukprot:8284193-Ditylum_brightwellii.AAC.1
MENPVTMPNIQQHQFHPLLLNEMRRQKSNQFPVKIINNRPLICYRENINNPEGLWKTVLPTALVLRVIMWYHYALGHSGANRLYEMIQARFHALDL